MNKIEIRDFDPANYLNSKKMIEEYLNQVLADGNINEIIEALSDIERAKKLHQIKDLKNESNFFKTFEDVKNKLENLIKDFNFLKTELSKN